MTQKDLDKILKEMVPYVPAVDDDYGRLVARSYAFGFKSAIVEVQKLLLKEQT